MSPKVFVSHASEDKERFVIPFATRLRATGVDAWVDLWEMQLGDRLIRKIFDEGLTAADVVVAVISKNSVQKPWVREELDAAFVNRIDKGIKIIPIVLDECEVPLAFRSTVWVPIKDLNSYDQSFDRIVSSIFGVTDKPPLGTPPMYTQQVAARISNLSQLDSQVLQMACEYELKAELGLINLDKVYMAGGAYVIPQDELKDSIEMLQHAGYVDPLKIYGGGPKPFKVTTSGFETYCNACIANYPEVANGVALALVNKGLRSSDDVAAELGCPRRLVNHVFQILAGRQHIRLSAEISHTKHVIEVSAALRRAMAS